MDEEVSEVLPGLYLGSLSGLKYLEALGITHVLSVVNYPIQKDLQAFVTLQLPLQDSEGVNMLQYLPAAIKFLDAALGKQASGAPQLAAAAGAAAAAGQTSGAAGAGGGGSDGCARVLVHCQAGVSRSAAVVAAWLMRSRGMSTEEALAFLRSRRSVVSPNEGFRAQLTLFEDMRCSLDASHPVYRMWCLEELASQYEEQGYVDPLTFGQLPDGPAGLSEALAARQTLYRCRKCRQLLASSAHVIPVEAAMGHRTFRRQRHPAALRPEASADSASESCLFVEPMQWMAETITGAVAGKLHCPKCAARLGSFNWSGISNPSGAWVTPAFQLHHSKLDTVLPQPLEAIANVRQPLLSRTRPAPVSTTSDPSASFNLACPSASASADAPSTAAAGAAAPSPAATATAAAAAAPCLPSTLPAVLRRMGLGRAGGGLDDDDVEEQLPEPQLILDPEQDPGTAPGRVVEALPANGQASAPAAAGHGQPGAEGSGPAGRAEPVRQGCAEPCFAGTAATAAGGDCAVAAGQDGGCKAAWFTHLILDCDGVMVDSEAASCEALRRAILEVTGFDIPHTFPGDYVEVFGMDVRSCVAHYRERFDRTDWDSPEELAPRVQAAKEVHYKQLTEGGITAFDGAERLIRRALAAGMQVGVASSGAPEKIAHNLASSGLAPLVPPHAIVSAAHVAAGKPAPDVYLAAMKATGCSDPRRALVVEDAVNGLKAARAAGMFAVGITNQLPATLLGPWAEMVVDHLDQVDPGTLAPEPAPAVEK